MACLYPSLQYIPEQVAARVMMRSSLACMRKQRDRHRGRSPFLCSAVVVSSVGSELAALCARQSPVFASWSDSPSTCHEGRRQERPSRDGANQKSEGSGSSNFHLPPRLRPASSSRLSATHPSITAHVTPSSAKINFACIIDSLVYRPES